MRTRTTITLCRRTNIMCMGLSFLLPSQALQQVFRQEVSNGRTRCSQLQEALHQRSTDLEAAQSQLATAREERAAAEAQQQHVQQQLQAVQAGNSLLRQQMSQVGCHAKQRGRCGLVQLVWDYSKCCSMRAWGAWVRLTPACTLLPPL